MQWFKHDSTANQDAKLKRLRMKYGLEGYGLYWYCLELIAGEVGVDNVTFELEHDAEIISFDTGIHHERVNEMMRYMVDLGLFESSANGYISCMKLAKRLDKSMTSNPKMRSIIEAVRLPSTNHHDDQLIGSCKISIDETIQDKPLGSSADEPAEKKGYPEEFERAWKLYPKRLGTNPKRGCYQAWNARIKKDGYKPDQMIEGLKRYIRFAESTAIIGTERVMQGKRFFGPACEFDEPWETTDCPHNEIVKIWAEIMPDHIRKPSIDDWLPSSSAYKDLDIAWNQFKTKPRTTTGKPVFNDNAGGLAFYRQVFEKLSSTQSVARETAGQYITIGWAVKKDNTVSIHKGEIQ